MLSVTDKHFRSSYAAVPVQPVEPDGDDDQLTTADRLLSVATPYRDDGSIIWERSQTEGEKTSHK